MEHEQTTWIQLLASKNILSTGNDSLTPFNFTRIKNSPNWSQGQRRVDTNPTTSGGKSVQTTPQSRHVGSSPWSRVVYFWGQGSTKQRTYQRLSIKRLVMEWIWHAIDRWPSGFVSLRFLLDQHPRFRDAIPYSRVNEPVAIPPRRTGGSLVRALINGKNNFRITHAWTLC